MSSEPPAPPPEPPPPPSPPPIQPARPVSGEPSSSPPSAGPRSPDERLPSGNDSSLLPEARLLGWNWGGFLLPYLWLIGHGRVTPALILWLSLGLPFVGFVHLFLYPATAIYLGLNGFEVAWRYRGYHSVAGLQESEKEWVIWGVVLNLLVIFSIVITLVYFKAMLLGMWEGMDPAGW